MYQSTKSNFPFIQTDIPRNSQKTTESTKMYSGFEKIRYQEDVFPKRAKYFGIIHSLVFAFKKEKN